MTHLAFKFSHDDRPFQDTKVCVVLEDDGTVSTVICPGCLETYDPAPPLESDEALLEDYYCRGCVKNGNAEMLFDKFEQIRWIRPQFVWDLPP